MKPIALLFLISCSVLVATDVRELVALPAWQFAPENSPNEPASPPALPASSTEWTPVTIPHIFRQSGLPDNAASWYRATFSASPADQGRRFLLVLEGAASVKDVYVNGPHLGQHKSA